MNFDIKHVNQIIPGILMASIVFASLSNVNALMVEFVELYFWSHLSNNEQGFDEPFLYCVPDFSSTEANASFEHETDLAALAIISLKTKYEFTQSDYRNEEFSVWVQFKLILIQKYLIKGLE